MKRRKKKDSQAQTILLTFGALFALQGLALVTLGKKSTAR